MYKNGLFWAILLATLLQAACGFKGDLYRPKAGDNASFGAVQTGIGLQAPDAQNRTVAPQK